MSSKNLEIIASNLIAPLVSLRWYILHITFKSSSVFNSIRLYFTFPSISIQTAWKLDLIHLSILGLGQHIIQLGSQEGETCGSLRGPKLYRMFHPVEVHLCLTQKLRHCKMFYLTTYDPYLYNFGFILDHTKWSLQSQPYKIVGKISTLQLALSNILQIHKNLISKGWFWKNRYLYLNYRIFHLC